MNNMVGLQAQVRREAEEQAEQLSALRSWTENIAKKEQKLLEKKQQGQLQQRVRGSADSTVGDSSSEASSTTVAKPARAPAAHVYDKGYKKWENFDENAADAGTEAKSKSPSVASSAPTLPAASTAVSTPYQPPSPAAETEQQLREEGNAHYKNGNYRAALKCFDKAVAADPRAVASLSNRAMTQLQLKNYAACLEDATAALKQDPLHIKSWLRRAAARNALGQHTAALLDLQAAALVEPGNVTVQGDIKKTKAHIAACGKELRSEEVSVLVADADASEGGLSSRWPAPSTEILAHGAAPALQQQLIAAAVSAPTPAPTAASKGVRFQILEETDETREETEQVVQQKKGAEKKGNEEKEEKEEKKPLHMTVPANQLAAASKHAPAALEGAAETAGSSSSTAAPPSPAPAPAPAASPSPIVTGAAISSSRAASLLAAALAPPKTASEFDKCWRSLKKREPAQRGAFLLEKVPASFWRAAFHTAMEADVLLEILAAFAAAADSGAGAAAGPSPHLSPAAAIAATEGLLSMKLVAMTVAMCSSGDKAAAKASLQLLHGKVEEAAARGEAVAGLVEKVRALQAVFEQ